jgi:hypothetical protein
VALARRSYTARTGQQRGGIRDWKRVIFASVLQESGVTMKQLAFAEYSEFISRRPVVAVHFDADWNPGRTPTRQRMLEAQTQFGTMVGFAEVDVDAEQELAHSIPVLNVSLVAYYRDGELVAALIGNGQNVAGRISRVLNGEPIGYADGC